MRFFLVLLFAVSAFALSDGGDFLVIPSAEILPNNAYQVRGTLGYHQSSCSSKGMCDRHPFVASLRYGLLGALDVGMQYGSTVSIDVKTALVAKYGVIPAVSLGARAFVQSPEAYFYSVSKENRRQQTGEFFGVAQWGSEWWKILGGVSAFPAMEADDVAPFWGYEQGLGTKKVNLVYEGFFRHGFSHHNLGLNFAPNSFLGISAGATEFYRYFFKDNGKPTFRIVNRNVETGYRAPGVYFSVVINGSISGATIPNQKLELDSLKKQVAGHERELAALREQLDFMEGVGSATAGGSPNNYINSFEAEFDSIQAEYKNDNWNLEKLREREQIFTDKGGAAKRFLIRTAKNKSLEQDRRITALRVMSHFSDEVYISPLADIAVDNSDLTVAREAILALGAMDSPNARKRLAEIANQTTGIVRETVIEIMGSL
ncbi:hypothetical protein AGMMS49938_00330 [Fibrobacterales bacterium]|nr:hypothetical protein AGMMS49938_00330 [Fibrobacterales bacterium]